MPALIVAALAYFVFTRRRFWITVAVLMLIGGLTGTRERLRDGAAPNKPFYGVALARSAVAAK